MVDSVFDTFDFTPVADNPFKRGAQPVSPVVDQFQRNQPDPNADALTQAASIPTDQTIQPDTMVGKAGTNIIKYLASLAGGDQSWSEYAGDPRHPMVARVGSAVGEEARRFVTGVGNDLQQFIGPMYGEGHVPMANEGVSGADYAGHGINLASLMGGPGPEGAVAAGWSPKAQSYLDHLITQKPALKPETAAVVQQMISKGPEWAAEFNKTSPPGTPGVGFSTLATSMHKMEEAKQAAPEAFVPGPKPVKPASWSPTAVKFLKEQGYAPGSFTPQDAAPLKAIPTPGPNSQVWLKALEMHDAEMAAKPSQAAPTAAPGPSAAPAPKPAKKPVTVSSTPLTPQQALGIGGGASPAEMAKLFSTQVPGLKVPEMLPYDPNKTGQAALPHETAPGTSGKMTPFNPENLPMDNPSVIKRMQEQGFAPIGGNWLYWRGIKEKGPFSWDSAQMGYRDPSTKTNEPGIFLAPDTNAQGKPGKPIAQMYGSNVNPHVVRADNPLVIEYSKATGGSSQYSSTGMQKAIKDAWGKGHDAVLFKNINDLGGKHDQLVVRHSNQLRHPHAVFNPNFKQSPNLLAAGGANGIPMVVKPGEEGGDDDQ